MFLDAITKTLMSMSYFVVVVVVDVEKIGNRVPNVCLLMLSFVYDPAGRIEKLR